MSILQSKRVLNMPKQEFSQNSDVTNSCVDNLPVCSSRDVTSERRHIGICRSNAIDDWLEDGERDSDDVTEVTANCQPFLQDLRTRSMDCLIQKGELYDFEDFNFALSLEFPDVDSNYGADPLDRSPSCCDTEERKSSLTDSQGLGSDDEIDEDVDYTGLGCDVGRRRHSGSSLTATKLLPITLTQKLTKFFLSQYVKDLPSNMRVEEKEDLYSSVQNLPDVTSDSYLPGYTPTYFTTPPIIEHNSLKLKEKRSRMTRALTFSSTSSRESVKEEFSQESEQLKKSKKPRGSRKLVAALSFGEGSSGTSTSKPLRSPKKSLKSSKSVPMKLNQAMLLATQISFEAPGAPTNVQLTVAGTHSLTVHFFPPNNSVNVTAYRVEWSKQQDFCPLTGSHVVPVSRDLFYDIVNLEKGQVYYVRIFALAGQILGHGAISCPPYAVPSDWREVTNSRNRWEGKKEFLDELITNLKNTSDPGSDELIDVSPARKMKVKKTLKSLFTAAPKLHRTFKGGIYLAAVIHHDGRVLVTGDDMIPVVEVDSDYSTGALQGNLHWLMKVSCMWQDIKQLLAEVQKSAPNSTAKQFRAKILHAIVQLQTILGMYDLGQLNYQPIKDPETGSLILVAVRSLKDTKQAPSSANVRWMSLGKLQRRSGRQSRGGSEDKGQSAANETSSASEGSISEGGQSVSEADGRLSVDEEKLTGCQKLVNSTLELIAFQYLSGMRLPKGLYLGYLKLSSSLDNISIQLHKHQPNVLPNVKVRGNHNVSREEWEWLRSLKSTDDVTNLHKASPAQMNFHNQIMTACGKLFEDLGVDKSSAMSHRVYDTEVIDLGHGVTFIVVLPPPEEVCTKPGQLTNLLLPKVPLKTLPVQVFEILHQRTYLSDLIRRFSQLSCHLDARVSSAQQSIRKSFFTADLESSRRKLSLCNEMQRHLDESYKSVRWIVEVITASRDSNVNCGPTVAQMYTSASSNFLNQQTMYLPTSNTPVTFV